MAQVLFIIRNLMAHGLLLSHLDGFIASATYNSNDTVTLILQSTYISSVYGYIDDVYENGASITSAATYNGSNTDAYGYEYIQVTLDPQDIVASSDSDYGTYTMDAFVNPQVAHIRAVRLLLSSSLSLIRQEI